MKKKLVRTVLCLSLVVIGVLGTACNGTEKTATGQEMTGQQAHERHMTGIESQVGDF